MFGSAFLALTLGTAGALASPLSAEPARHCGTQITREQILAKEALFQEHYVEPSNSFAPLTVNVPVAFHVIQKNETLEGGNVPESQLEEQIAVLNADYEGSGLTFSIANITRTTNPDWFDNDPENDDEIYAIKSAIRQGGKETLNVWTVGWEVGNGLGLGGFSTFPSDYEENPETDGVMLRFNTLPGGSIGPRYNTGKILSHEAGHWLGLYHTFQDGCEGGDLVDDTPPEAEPTSGCPVGKDTCPGDNEADPIQNIMDYSDNTCMTGFTLGQFDRLRNQTRTYRGFDI